MRTTHKLTLTIAVLTTISLPTPMPANCAGVVIETATTTTITHQELNGMQPKMPMVFAQEPIQAPTMPVNNDQASDTKHDRAIQFKQMENMDGVIFIDTGSSVNTIKN